MSREKPTVRQSRFIESDVDGLKIHRSNSGKPLDLLSEVQATTQKGAAKSAKDESEPVRSEEGKPRNATR